VQIRRRPEVVLVFLECLETPGGGAWFPPEWVAVIAELQAEGQIAVIVDEIVNWPLRRAHPHTTPTPQPPSARAALSPLPDSGHPLAGGPPSALAGRARCARQRNASRCTNDPPPPAATLRTGRWFSWMHYSGFTPDFMVMGKATGLPMILANKKSWACVDLPTLSVTTVPAERLLRCAHLMEQIFSDDTSTYYGIAGAIEEYHAEIHGAIMRCMEAEEARQQAWQAASPNDQVQALEVHADVWSRFRAAAGTRGERVPAFWGGVLLWFSVAAARRLGDERGGPAHTALGFLTQAGLGRTSNFMRAIFTFHSNLAHLQRWLRGDVWVYTTQNVRKPGPPLRPPAATRSRRK